MIDKRTISLDEIREGVAGLDRDYPDSAMAIYRPTEEQRSFLDRVLQHYQEAPQERRNEICDAFRGRLGPLNMLVGYAYEAAAQVGSTGDEAWLRAGLTAAAIEDSLGRVDYRDRLLMLAELYVSAEEAGLDPRPAFDAICGLSDFSDYAVVKSRRKSLT